MYHGILNNQCTFLLMFFFLGGSSPLVSSKWLKHGKDPKDPGDRKSYPIYKLVSSWCTTMVTNQLLSGIIFEVSPSEDSLGLTKTSGDFGGCVTTKDLPFQSFICSIWSGNAHLRGVKLIFGSAHRTNVRSLVSISQIRWLLPPINLVSWTILINSGWNREFLLWWISHRQDPMTSDGFSPNVTVKNVYRRLPNSRSVGF